VHQSIVKRKLSAVDRGWTTLPRSDARPLQFIALSAAPFWRAGQLATADTCSRAYRCVQPIEMETDRLADRPCYICSNRPRLALKKVTHTRLPSVWVPELIPVLGSQPAGDVCHKPGDRLPLLFATPAVTPATLKRAATNFAVW